MASNDAIRILPSLDVIHENEMYGYGMMEPLQLPISNGPEIGIVTSSNNSCYEKQKAIIVDFLEDDFDVEKLNNYAVFERNVRMGEGTYGVVYKCFDVAKKENVAIKELKEDGIIVCEHEVNMLRMLKGTTNVVQLEGIYSIESDETHDLKNGDTILVFELLPRHLTPRLVEDPLHALTIMLDVAKGIHEIHNKGYLHRDIKRSNIMLTKNGVAKIIDLGLMVKLSSTDHYMGTPGYADPRANNYMHFGFDIFGIGSTFYRLIFNEIYGYEMHTQNANYTRLLIEIDNIKQAEQESLEACRILNVLGIDVTEHGEEEAVAARNTYLTIRRRRCLYTLVAACLHPNVEKRPGTSTIIAIITGVLDEKRCESIHIETLLSDTCYHQKTTSSYIILQNSLSEKHVNTLFCPDQTTLEKHLWSYFYKYSNFMRVSIRELNELSFTAFCKMAIDISGEIIIKGGGTGIVNIIEVNGDVAMYGNFRYAK